MDFLTRDELRNLIETQGEWCVSMFMPAVRAGSEVQQNPIRFKNLLRTAQDRLAQLGLRAPDVEKFLQPAADLLDDADFWRHQSSGLAIFLADDFLSVHRLPLLLPELVVVTHRFHIKPLLPLLSGNGKFYVLALSQDEVRLFEGTRDTITKVPLEGVPTSLDEALHADDPERDLRFSMMQQSVSGRDARGQFHGQSGTGQGGTEQKDNILRYFHRVEEGVTDLLDTEEVPLVLAGVDYLLPLYRQTNEYRHLLDEEIHGNPEQWSAKEIHQRAWDIVQPYYTRYQDEQAALFRQFQGQGDGRATTHLKEALQAVTEGRVGALFVALGVQQWGTFDPNTFTLHVHPERQPNDQDLLDWLAVQTYLNGGTVYAVDRSRVPGGETLAAVFRYEL